MLKSLLAAFEDETHLPVEVEKVRDVVLRISDADVITFEEGENKPEVLRGLLMVYDELPRPYAESRRIAVVYLNRELDDRYRRLTAVKELIHLLDPPQHRTQRPAEVDSLVRRMAKPIDLQGFSIPELVDRQAEFLALAVLLPLHLRRDIKPHYDSGRISAHELAQLAQLPERYVTLIMEDSWPELIDHWVSQHEKDCAADIAIARSRRTGRKP